MKRKVTVAAVLVFLGFGILNAQIDFIKVTSSAEMDEVWEKAAAENKNVFVDVFATWCGPCKWMDANVFSLEEAGEFMSNGFISVKMNGESEYGTLFARANGLQAYPSLFIFNSDQKMMNMLVGAQEWEGLELALQNTVDFFPVYALYQSKYDAELLTEDEYPAFISAMRKLRKDDMAVAVVNHYKEAYMEGAIVTTTDIGVIAFYVEPGTEEWKLLTEDVMKLKSSLGPDLTDFIEQSVEKSIMTSVEDYDFSITQEFIDLLPELTKGTELDAGEIDTRSHIYYYHYSENFEGLIGYVESIYAGSKKGDHAWLYKAAGDAVFLDARNLQMTKKGVEWFTICIQEKESYDYYFHLGLSQYFSNMAEESLISFRKAGELATNDEERETAKSVISEIEAQ